MPVNQENLDDVFTYHAPTGEEQLQAYREIRAAGHTLAAAILKHTKVCGDQQAAIRKTREAVWCANAAIALNGAI